MKFAFATTLFPKQLPLDIAGVIATAPRERFLDFWNTWDRPARMAVVGDIAVALVEKLIAAQFTDLAARGPARPDPSLGEIVKTDGVRAYFFSEAEMPNTRISVLSRTLAGAEPDTAANRLKPLPARSDSR